MVTAHFARGARGAAHVIGAAALNYLVLTLPEPAKELVDIGIPGWTACATCLSARAGNALRALGMLRRS